MLYINVGHGGVDSGCTFSDGSYEKDYNLKMANRVYALIKPYFKDAVIDRISDSGLSLQGMAENMNALAVSCKELDVFSFHCNANDKVSRGVEILLSQYNKSETEWTDYFLKEYAKLFGIPNRGIWRRLLKDGRDYYYLHRATSANVHVKILELGFGDNASDLAILKSKFEDIAQFCAGKILEKYGLAKKIEPNPEVYKSSDIILKECLDSPEVWKKRLEAYPFYDDFIKKLYYHKKKL